MTDDLDPADFGVFGYATPQTVVLVNGGSANAAMDHKTLDTGFVMLHLSFRHGAGIQVGVPTEWAVKLGVSLLEAAAAADRAGLDPPELPDSTS